MTERLMVVSAAVRSPIKEVTMPIPCLFSPATDKKQLYPTGTRGPETEEL